jgi:hypothetical protein
VRKEGKQEEIEMEMTLVGKKRQGAREDKAEREKEQRRKGNGTPQGLMRKIRKMQGPICKAKFSVDLKP